MPLIKEYVAAVETHLSAIADIFANPDAATFTANADSLPALERALNLKAGIDAAIAYAADQANAGDRVGSSRTIDYLIKELGLSYNQANARLRLGHQNHGKVTIPEPTVPEASPEAENQSSSAQDSADEQRRREEAQRKDEQQRRRAESERLKQEEATRATSRENSRDSRISQEKLAIIDRELEKLNSDARLSRNEIYARAVIQANTRSPEDLREWVRTRVNQANTATKDPLAAWKKRELKISRPDSDGGANIYGYVSADTLALLETALAPAARPGHLVDDPTVKDTRTLPQRRHDALSVILGNHSAEKINRTGIGTIVISMSAKDIDNLADPSADHRYPTNTNAMLTPADILRLGATKYNFAVVHDPNTGDPLHVARTERLATVEQRIALLASQLVCTNPDCTQPFCNCEIHHLIPWQRGGGTDIWNLAVLCRPHHGDNNDYRNGRGARGHAERDPETGRVGYRPPPRPGNPHPAVELNNTDRQEHSGGAKIRNQPWPSEQSESPRNTRSTAEEGRPSNTTGDSLDETPATSPDHSSTPMKQQPRPGPTQVKEKTSDPGPEQPPLFPLRRAS
ncbi:DUF222 domain-containing protein [Corynebacterium sp. A21]|uniref:DUF222 domain-containing protein n=1 Tax=Corynebacterium sp. A21 TaxID=3457318 RepID=UPI003FD3292B